jgi:hypothetical protein
MAVSIDHKNLSLDKTAALRFVLGGSGGGVYNIVLSKEKVAFVEGAINQADLILAMQTTDFNKLVFQI